jgi:Tfp pilus assembly protein PilX
MRTNFHKLESALRRAPSRGRAVRKRGVVLIAVLVLFAVSLTLFGLWSQSVIREHSRMATQQFRLQAVRLAEAGLQRAALLRATDGKYVDEVWSIPATQLDQTHAAQVRIHVTPASDPGGIRYEATAEFPVGVPRRVQITKSLKIPNPAPVNKP